MKTCCVKRLLVVLLLGFFMIQLTLVSKVTQAASGRMTCEADEIAQMSPKMQKRMQKICERKVKHAKKDKAISDKRKAWYNKHVKGHKAMESVVSANHGRNPSKVEDLGNQIVWLYRSKSNNKVFAQCKEYVFTHKGDQLKSRRNYVCE